MKKYIILATVVLLKITAHADVKTVIKPYSYSGDLLVDTQLKVLHDEQIKIAATIIPLQVRQGFANWDAIPEYYASVKSDRFGKITIGAHNADLLIIDAGTFAVGSIDILSDGNHLYSQSLVNKLQPQGYRYKISYLVKRDNLYYSSGYSPLDNTTQARICYANSISAATDFKASISVINKKIVAGFNLKYLGILLGGSYGSDFYTAGIGYYIGPFKSSLTYLNEGKNTVFGMQYNLSKNISPFIQVGNAAISGKNLAIGLRMHF